MTTGLRAVSRAQVEEEAVDIEYRIKRLELVTELLAKNGKMLSRIVQDVAARAIEQGENVTEMTNHLADLMTNLEDLIIDLGAQHENSGHDHCTGR